MPGMGIFGATTLPPFLVILATYSPTDGTSIVLTVASFSIRRVIALLMPGPIRVAVFVNTLSKILLEICLTKYTDSDIFAVCIKRRKKSQYSVVRGAGTSGFPAILTKNRACALIRSVTARIGRNLAKVSKRRWSSKGDIGQLPQAVLDVLVMPKERE